MKTVKITNRNWHMTDKELEIRFYPYEAGGIAIELNEPGNDWEVWARCTICPDFPLEAGEVTIKNYSENEGLYESLLDAGVIEKAHREIPCGWISAPVAFLTPEWRKEADRQIKAILEEIQEERFAN